MMMRALFADITTFAALSSDPVILLDLLKEGKAFEYMQKTLLD